MEWTPARQKPVLFMSDKAVFAEGEPIRGGLPVCWPWFGGREDLPSHGFARLRFWDFVRGEDSAEGVELVFRLHGNGDLGWPYPFELNLNVHLGETLAVALEMKHLGESTVEISAALHTYLRVGAIEQTRVEGLAGSHYLDSLDDHRKRSQVGAVIFDREVDRVYLADGDVRVVDPVWQRTLDIDKSGSRATVVWNPWIEKSKRLADLPDDAYHDFLCIEAANTSGDVVRLAPQGTHLLRQMIRVG
jgi:glucose-6-phosphate 1-epimerase